MGGEREGVEEGSGRQGRGGEKERGGERGRDGRDPKVWLTPPHVRNPEKYPALT